MSERGPLPVTVLTGFLGAGKTTLLRRIVRELPEVRIGLLINEMGPAGIDPAAQSERLIELGQGCVCCVQNADLVKALGELHARGDLDRVVVETTGLADPMPVTWTLERPDLAHLARLDGVITVVDAVNFGLTDVEEWRAQVAGGDLIVLSKLDLVGAEGADKTRRAIEEVQPGARVVAAAEAPAGMLVDPETEEEDGPGPGPGPGHGRHSDFRTVMFRDGTVYEEGRLEDFLEAMPGEVFRAKGIVRTGRGWFGFQAVGGRLHSEPGAAAPPHGESRMVFFGRGLDGETLRARLALCQLAGSG